MVHLVVVISLSNGLVAPRVLDLPRQLHFCIRESPNFILLMVAQPRHVGLFAFSDGEIDRFLITREEIPLVAAWFCVRDIADYTLREVELNDEVLCEVCRDRRKVQFRVRVLELLPHLR